MVFPFLICKYIASLSCKVSQSRKQDSRRNANLIIRHGVLKSRVFKPKLKTRVASPSVSRIRRTMVFLLRLEQESMQKDPGEA